MLSENNAAAAAANVSMSAVSSREAEFSMDGNFIEILQQTSDSLEK